MLFKKKLILDVFTHNPAIMEAAPVDYTHKFYPNWWKILSRTADWEGHAPIKNMKSCYGFIRQYSHGVVIPLWTDIAFLFDENGVMVKPADHTFIDSSNVKQWEGYLPATQYSHVKLTSPWLFRCNEEVEFSYQSCVWNLPDVSTAIIPPGTVDYKYQHVTNINMFVNRDTKKESFILPYGQPMVQITPHTERELVLRRHLIPKEEFLMMNDRSFGVSFTGSFLKRRRVVKEKGACPFFGDLK